MSQRSNPARSTRGKKPTKTNQQQNKDDQLYAKMFGQNLDDDEDYAEKARQSDIRKDRIRKNIHKYPYARSFTYYFDLNEFPRLEGHPSYAVDETNIFNSTYSQQSRNYKQSHLSDLISRKYFGLPTIEEQDRLNKKQGKSHNICHQYLFQNQDQKWKIDRAIHTHKMMIKNLQKLVKNKQIRLFQFTKRDITMNEITKHFGKQSQTTLLERYGSRLQQNLKILEQRKLKNINLFYYQDESFFHHSLNQILHNKIQELKKLTYPNRIYASLFTNDFHLQGVLQNGAEDLELNLTFILQFYNSKDVFISPEALSNLLQKYPAKITRIINEKPFITVPTQVYAFGPSNLLEITNSILATRIQHSNEPSFYSARFAWRKLFKTELQCSKQLKSINLEDYTVLSKRIIQQCKYYSKNTKIEKQKQQVLTIDHLINYQQLNKEQTTPINLLKEGDSFEITGKQFVIIVLYSWICKAIREILPFLEHNPQFFDVIANENYKKYSYGVIQALAQPIVGTLQANISMLSEVLSQQNIFDDIDFKLYFEFDRKTNIGILRKKRVEQDPWETDKEEEQQEQIGSQQAGEQDKQEKGEDFEEGPKKLIKEN